MAYKNIKPNNRKRLLVPASKLPKLEKGESLDFRETMQWRIFRIMSEFVDGFEFLADFKKSVTFFGSARTLPDNFHYNQARKLGYKLAKAGYAVVTGGGPGIMEAANRGANEAGGDSIGFNIQLKHEQRINDYITHGLGFHYFFSRKLMLSFSAQAYVFLPGGYGTLDEVFEIITLIQTQKIPSTTKVILMGKDFWDPLDQYIKKFVYEKEKAIDKADMDLYHITDSVDEAFKIIKAVKYRKIEL